MPFQYGSLSSFRVYLAVEPALAERLLADTGFIPVRFDGDAVVALDLQRYTAHGPTFLATTSEIELTAVGAPARDAGRLPPMRLGEFLRGADETRTLGYYRLHVPCDNAFAVDAGIALFGERKYVAAIRCEAPSPNGHPEPTWDYACDVDGVPAVRVRADLRGRPWWSATQAAIVRYATLEGRLSGARWDLVGDVRVFEGDPPGDLAIVPTDAPHALASDLRAIVAASRFVAARAYSSPPAATEGRAFYADEG